VESGNRKGLMLLVDLSQNDGGEATVLYLSLLLSLVVVDLGANGVSELGGADESHDVRVVLEDQNLLGGGLVISCGSDLDNGSLFEVGELNPESEGIESGTGGILQLELVGVVIKLEHLEDLGNDIEVTVSRSGLLKSGSLVLVDNSVGTEEGVGPLLEGLDDGNILGLLSGFLTGVSVRGIVDNVAKRGGLLGRVKYPGANIVHVDVELALVLVDSQLGSVDSDDVTDSVDDREVLESVSVDDNSSVVLSGSLRVEGGINDLQGANEEFVSLVREGSIDDDTIEVA